jgi:hypothetical protein
MALWAMVGMELQPLWADDPHIAPQQKATSSGATQSQPEPTPTGDWLARWEKNILSDMHNRYCDKEMGEEIGWLVSPFVNGFYYGYLVTRDVKWVDLCLDWTDSWVRRGVKEPDGYIGWPKEDGASTAVVPDLYTDNMLGEAMGLRPAVLMAGVILKTPALKAKYGEKARGYLRLAEQVYEKWDRRGCWREVRNGGLWVVPMFGIDRKTGGWTSGYAHKGVEGFSLPDNKQNLIAQWLIALYDVTGKPIYKARAAKWWKLMLSRMKLQQGDRYYAWNYWDPAGPWDYKPDGSTRHWVGVHPNGGYYDIDVEGIVTAFEHGIVFTRTEIDRLIATNRDYMWNRRITGAAFRRIDGGEPADPWKKTPGVLWIALTPYDTLLQRVFEANHDPASWGGLASTPWYLALKAGRLPAARSVLIPDASPRAISSASTGKP